MLSMSQRLLQPKDVDAETAARSWSAAGNGRRAGKGFAILPVRLKRRGMGEFRV